MNQVDNVYIEKWVKIYAVLESSLYAISRYRNKEISWHDMLRAIHSNIAEVFNKHLADEVYKEISDCSSAETTEIIKKIQNILVKRVFEEGA